MPLKRHFVRVPLLLLVAAAFSLPTFADTYQIVFSPAGSAISGTYTLTGESLTDLNVTFDGVTFDTVSDPATSAYLPASGTVTVSCGTGVAAAIAILSGACTTSVWEAYTDPASGTPTGLTVMFYQATGQSGSAGFGFSCGTAGVPACPPTLSAAANDFGTIGSAIDLTTTPLVTPEPGTLTMLFSGLLGLGLLIGMKRLG